MAAGGKTVAIAILVGTAMSAAWWWNPRGSFPPPSGFARTQVSAVRPLPPARPTVLGLRTGLPVPLPGFEAADNCFSPTLSSDLTQLVFSKFTEESHGFDLHLATRPSVDDPFSEPAHLQALAGPETEAYPTLSPDSLELLFVRSDIEPQIMICRRSDQSSAFGAPTIWPPAQQGEAHWRVGTPQYISGQQVVFSRIDEAAGTRSIWASDRSGDGTWSAPYLYVAEHGGTLYFNSDGTRGYYGMTDGRLYYQWRSTPGEPFGPPNLLLDGTATGPFDGTLWMSPAEDLVVYCSPGPSAKLGESRRLWMVRLQ